MVACPQFLALGPIYHTFNKTWRQILGMSDDGHRLLPAWLACLGAALGETLLTFGSQSRNAQMAYNNSFVAYSSVEEGARSMVPLNKPSMIWGVGAGPMYGRNILAAGGVRAMSPWLQERVEFGRGKAVICDVTCTTIGCLFTAPMNQLFNFLVTTPHAKTLPRQERWALARDFIYRQYFAPLPRASFKDTQRYSWRVTSIAARDFGLRTMYVSSVFSIYMAIERTICSSMRS